MPADRPFEIGDRVFIVGPTHPHRSRAGEIAAPATGGAASVGLDWEVKLDGAYAGGCFVTEEEIRHAS